MRSSGRNVVPRVAETVPDATQIDSQLSSDDELAVPSTIPASSVRKLLFESVPVEGINMAEPMAGRLRDTEVDFSLAI